MTRLGFFGSVGSIMKNERERSVVKTGNDPSLSVWGGKEKNHNRKKSGEQQKEEEELVLNDSS